MQIIRFVIALALAILFVFVLGLHHPYGSQLPPLGQFFNPFSGIWQNAGGHELRSEAFQLKGNTGPVKVVFDERQVPHIFAENMTDALYAQGFVTAKFRLWQMDVAVRAAGGFLSEVLGEQTVNTDIRQRRKGMLWAAERTWAAWQQTEEERSWIEAYTRGVNDYIGRLSPAEYPFEYKFLNYAPEPWTPVKSALFLKNMSEKLSSRNDDLAASNTLAALGRAQFDFLYPERNPKQSPVIPTGTPWDFTPVAVSPDSASGREMISGLATPHRSYPQPPAHNGSNNWAVAGTKTADGFPILGNDPHLDLTLPSIWFEIQLHTPELNAYGVSLPGVPGIIIGFNENIAWGVTNVGHDVLDWYRMIWADDARNTYLVDGERKSVEIRTEMIEVRGRDEPILEQVKYTMWGPVVHESEDAGQDLAMRWVAHDSGGAGGRHELSTFVGLMRAENYIDYSRALTSFDSPAQNFVFAAKDGDIALKVNGKFPLRRPEQGRFIQDGSSSAQAWPGFIPREQVPQVRNPERGFVSSANQRSTDNSYPYYYLGGFDDYRGRIINRRLDKMNGITVQDMMTLQNDVYSIKAEEGIPALLGQLDQTGLDEVEQQMVTDLSSWAFRFEADSKPAFLFDAWLNAAQRLTFDELIALGREQEVIYPETWRFLELIYDDPFHPIFDIQESPEKERAKEVVTRAFRETAAELKEQYLDDAFHWSAYKGTQIAHLGRFPGLGSGDLEVGGYGDAINALKSSHGPSWRMIVKMGPQVEAWGVYPGGQSGHPASPYYDNAVDHWRRGAYYPLHLYSGPDDPRLADGPSWLMK